MSPHFISSLSRFFCNLDGPGLFCQYSVLFYSITLHVQIKQGNELAQVSFFVTKIRFRIKLPVIMNRIVNGFPILNSDPSNAIHTAVSRF